MAYSAKQFYPVKENKPEVINNLPLELPRSKEFLFNRELSLIEFFRRVLDEGLDKSEPLLESLKFLCDFGFKSGRIFYDSRFRLKGKICRKNLARRNDSGGTIGGNQRRSFGFGKRTNKMSE